MNLFVQTTRAVALGDDARKGGVSVEPITSKHAPCSEDTVVKNVVFVVRWVSGTRAYQSKIESPSHHEDGMGG